MVRITRRGMLGAAIAGICLPRWSRAAEFTLRYGGNLPDSHPLSRRIAEAANTIAEQTGGRVRIDCFPNSRLGGDTAMLAQVQAGTLDFMTISGLILSRVVPVAAINGMGYAFSSYGEVWAAMDGLLGAYVRDAIGQAGLHATERMFDNGYRQMTSRKGPIAEPADFDGLTVRVPVSPLWSSLFTAFGAKPGVLDFAHTYDALRDGAFEAQENALGVIGTAKLYEVQHYCSMTNHMWDGFWFIANGALWDKLPVDLQGTISQAMNEAALIQRVDVRTLNDSLQGELESRGMVFNRPDPAPFREVLRQTGFYTGWQEKLDPQAWGLLENEAGTLD